MKSKIKFDHPQIKFGQETSLYLLVKATGPKGEKKPKRVPLNLSVVIDRSGSMRGEKLSYVKLAAQTLVHKLDVQDTLSLVIYDNQVMVLHPPEKVKHKDVFIRSISNIRTGGMTNLSGGWLQGCELVGSNLVNKGVNRTLLLTDGLANEGITDHNQLEAMAAQQLQQGVSTTTFGVGMGYNEDLLTRMAREGGGSFHFIDDPEQTDRLFQDELQDLFNVVGQDLTIAIETETAVRSLKQLYQYRRSGNQGALVYHLGQLYAEEDRFQLFELNLGALEKGKHTLGKITISYDKLQEGESERVEESHQIQIEAVAEKDFQTSPPDPEVEKIALIQGARIARQQAIAFADKREFGSAQEVLQSAAEAIRASGTGDKELLDLYDRLREEAQDMEFGERRYDAYVRKTQMSKASRADRFSIKSALMDDLHYRNVSSKESIERQGPPPRFIEWHGGQMALVPPEIRIGAAPDNDIVLQEILVEDHHCRLLNRHGEWFLEDLSQHGTMANGGRINGRFRLSFGDTIRLGKALLELR